MNLMLHLRQSKKSIKNYSHVSASQVFAIGVFKNLYSKVNL